MPHLRINWLYKYLKLGFVALCAVELVLISLLYYQADDFLKKIFLLIIIIYIAALLLVKYKELILTVILLIACFLSLMIFFHKRQNFNSNGESNLTIYPDQIKVEDNWFTGIANDHNNKIMISGNITDRDKRMISKGIPLIISAIDGEVSEIEAATNLGEFDYQKYYSAQGIYQRIKLKKFTLSFTKIDFFGKLHQIRYRLQKYFDSMPQLLGFFSSELILAENNSSKNQRILNNYRNLGVIHLLSISGLHVGIYTLVVSFLCFSLKFTEEETFLLCVLVLLVGIFLSDGQAGFIRASLSYILGKIFSFHKIKLSGIDLLGLTCLIHILFLPQLFLNVGAILSYILALGLQLTSKIPSIFQSILLNLLLTPFLLIYFFQINVLTVIFNLLIVPYFNWIVLPITFLNMFTANSISKFSGFLENILENTETIIEKISKTNFGIITFGKIEWWQCAIVLFLSLVFLFYLNEHKAKLKIKIRFIYSLLIVYILLFISIHCPSWGQVTFIDVGQGDSILITTPFPRKVYMIDTGGKLNFSGKKLRPQIEKTTIPMLKAQGISKIDGLFVSHQDADHVGDVRPLLEEIQVDHLYMAKGLIKNASFRKRIDGVINRTELVELIAGMQVKDEKINFNVVYPFKPGSGKNEDSLSLLFNLAGKNWLFTGDLGQEGEKEIITKMPNLRVDYFKLGHHGSKTSSNPDFLKQIAPEKVFISAGRNNRFGHPHKETLDTLKSQNIQWASTQDCGMISWYYGKFIRSKFEAFMQKGK
ncbi:DNA internalization-related competence protein ComEC/Rec2 [Lactobacillus agrestimuris]|uniref:DNA internalization-related competence protein ComEC/Rec2 n=1 Tax=Lactobacillus agrestimuris TaxID=2941328 RepID=UPI00204479CE|nr:DNA internalization-related competence protein ComEC/Rec2 [Lactobacillus agrestimuris]